MSQRLDRHELERALVGGAEIDRCSDPRVPRLDPARGANAPAVARLQSGEAPLSRTVTFGLVEVGVIMSTRFDCAISDSGIEHLEETEPMM